MLVGIWLVVNDNVGSRCSLMLVVVVDVPVVNVMLLPVVKVGSQCYVYWSSMLVDVVDVVCWCW
jgi:hypothetical protein